MVWKVGLAMRTTLALCLTAGLAHSGRGRADNHLVVVAPFQVLDSRPDCAGPGKIPFQVAIRSERRQGALWL